ncbi:MAG: HAD-IIIA family hydrolase [Solirubrobacterales bacterium]|nr:HAD-IIIA family hydrolase [Solirubrobacterales bacterium]
MSAAAVFLDRDGVLTEAPVLAGRPQSPRLASELVILAGAAGACATLRDAGFRLVCITNQPEIARGGLDPRELEAMGAMLERELGLDEVVVCPHDDADCCECRKPGPGMILAAAERLDIDLAASFTVGDRWRDIDAGSAARTRTVFIDRGYDEPLRAQPDVVVGGVEEAAGWIVEQTRQR